MAYAETCKQICTAIQYLQAKCMDANHMMPSCAEVSKRAYTKLKVRSSPNDQYRAIAQSQVEFTSL